VNVLFEDQFFAVTLVDGVWSNENAVNLFLFYEIVFRSFPWLWPSSSSPPSCTTARRAWSIPPSPRFRRRSGTPSSP